MIKSILIGAAWGLVLGWIFQWLIPRMGKSGNRAKAWRPGRGPEPNRWNFVQDLQARDHRQNFLECESCGDMVPIWEQCSCIFLKSPHCTDFKRGRTLQPHEWGQIQEGDSVTFPDGHTIIARRFKDTP